MKAIMDNWRYESIPHSGTDPFKFKGSCVNARRKGAKTQGFGFLASLIRWKNDSSPSFPSHLPAVCVFGSWRLCVNCLLGKGWLSAFPRFPPLSGCRAELLLASPLAKRVESGSSKSVDSEDACLADGRLQSAALRAWPGGRSDLTGRRHC